jgi:hypothetical protein
VIARDLLNRDGSAQADSEKLVLVPYMRWNNSFAAAHSLRIRKTKEQL